MEVKDLRVHSFSRDYLDLSWEVTGRFDQLPDYAFSVERSESPEGPFDQISKEFSYKIQNFRDGSVALYDRWRLYWYRIKIRRKSDDELTYSSTFSNLEEPSLTAMEIQRQFLLGLKEKFGRKTLLFPVRSTGEHCPSCWDPVRQRQIKSSCQACFGSGFAGGYLDPIVIWAQIDPYPKFNQQSANPGQQQNVITLGRTISYPPIKPGDLLVEHTNKRWQVAKVDTSQILRSPVRQELTLVAVDVSDIESLIPVNWQEDQPSPEREFTNPMNLEGTHP